AKVTEIDGRVDTLEGNPNVASTDSDAPPTASSNGELDRSSGDASNRVAGEPGSGDMSSVMDGDSDKGGRPSVGGISTGGNQQVATNAGGGTAAAVDAETKTYVDTTATQTLSQANAYTDAKFAAWDDTFTAFQDEIDHRFAEQDRRIDKQGAMGAAMLNMATSAAGIRTQNRVGVGVGFQGGESALSVGYQRAISDRAVITIGGAFSGDESSVGLGAGFGW